MPAVVVVAAVGAFVVAGDDVGAPVGLVVVVDDDVVVGDGVVVVVCGAGACVVVAGAPYGGRLLLHIGVGGLVVS